MSGKGTGSFFENEKSSLSPLQSYVILPSMSYFDFVKGDLDGPNFSPSLYFYLSIMATWTALITFVLEIKENQCCFVEIDRCWDRP